MDVRMDGRIALVTGASDGLGRAMAQKFAESGAQVALLARRPEPLEQARAAIEQASGSTVRGYSCDVGKADQIAATFAQVISDFGKVDILVNNAGTSRRGKFEEVTDEDWQADLDLKLFGAIRLARLAFPGMKSRQWGRIINVLNTGAKAPKAEGAPTAVSRAAGMALTKVLAGEGAPHGVLVNALCTGQLVSGQWERRHKREAPNQPWEEFLAEKGRHIPVGRLGRAEEFASMACFLASEASSFITGTAINVDGGVCPVV